jgi:NAD(P)-dependent dehydrogenase (short-subunit alcohol dehydrogenase family)
MPKGTVLVTGASSGIGRASALLLVENGFMVFAAVRKASDGEQLQRDAGPGLHPVIMDVTDGGSIQAAVARVSEILAGSNLDGLVNVAGIGLAAPLEFVTQDDLRRMFDVNVFGQLAVTQAFLPLLHRSRGRIVNMSSVGAHIAIPFGGVLNACKAAFGTLSDTLRMELRPFGIRVSTIEPAAIRTPAVEKTLGHVDETIDKLPPEGARRYGAMMRAFNRRALPRELHGSPPEVVARVVLHALSSPRPRIRYVVGKLSRPMTLLPRLLPDSVLDDLRMRVFGLSGAAREDH